MTNMYTLSSRSDIFSHIQILADLQLPVAIESNNGFKQPDCRLICGNSNSDNVFICLPSRKCPDSGTMHVRYTLHEMPYEFSSKIKGQADIHDNMTLLPIRVPKTIRSVNRRLFNRTKFTPNDPLYLHIQIPNHDIIRVLAEDISAGGIGFFVPEDLNLFTLGDQYAIKLYLPEYGQIQTQINVRNLRKFIRMFRIGVKFTSLDVKYRMKIIELVTRCISASEHLYAAESEAQKKCLLVDDQGIQPPLWPFLEESYDVLRRSLITHSRYTGGIPPELMILNLDTDSALKTLKAVRKSSNLRCLPLILSSERYATLPANIPEVRFARSSIPPQELTLTIDRLINEYRWSQKVGQMDINKVPMTKILLLDRCHVLPNNILSALIHHPFDIAVINDEKNLINRSSSIDPDVVLMVHSQDRERTMTILKLLNFNKSLKTKPKILLTFDQDIADDLKIQSLVTQSMALPVTAQTLIQAITYNYDNDTP